MGFIMHRLKATFSEPYRIEHGWGLSPIRSKRELKALVRFCENELKDKEHMALNPKRKELFKATIKLATTGNPVKVEGKEYIEISMLVSSYTGWYWS